MNPTAAVETVNKLPTNGDPLLELVKWALLIIVIVMMAVGPAMLYARKAKKDKNEDIVESAMSGAGSTLYQHLSDQVKEYRQIADNAYAERNALFDRVAKLEAKSEEFTRANESLDRLKLKLEAKDLFIQEKDSQLKELLDQGAKERTAFMAILNRKDAELTKANERILTLEKEVADLKVRLTSDEASMSRPMCPFHGRTEAELPPISHDTGAQA